ncbi:STAS-like domain-containing protein [Pontibacter populi]|uniref:STAS-like domain-containing protein n=1 Tax=Pontibacter populi TaxID=890055 RepID=A0ABV1RQ02_9BACT
MKMVSLLDYSPIISDRLIGDEIYTKIKSTLTTGGPVTVDLDGIKSMATFCAKQIFGRLYLELGSSEFFNQIQLKNATDDVKTIIRIGIQNALEERSAS